MIHLIYYNIKEILKTIIKFCKDRLQMLNDYINKKHLTNEGITPKESLEIRSGAFTHRKFFLYNFILYLLRVIVNKIRSTNSANLIQKVI